MGWKGLCKTRESGVWFFRDAGGWLGSGVWPMLMGAVDWVRKGSYHTAWAISGGSLCTCSYAHGRGAAVGPHSGAVFATASRFVEGYHLLQNNYSFDALQAYCFGINIKL